MPDPRQPASERPSFLSSDKAGTPTLRIKVIPRAGRTGLGGLRDGALLVRLAAAPVDGAANDELLEFLASRLLVARRHLTLTLGERSRDKVVTVRTLTVEEIAGRLR
ncbi:MAG: DUF167 domain-containing protein [Vicinamibacterales bacterium]